MYVHYGDTDKRLDEWIPETDLRNIAGELRHREADNAEGSNTRKRKRDSLSPLSPTPHQPSTDTPGMADGTKPKVPLTEEEFDIRHHKQITAKRNFDKVNFGQWQIKTWCVRVRIPPAVSMLLSYNLLELGTFPHTHYQKPRRTPRGLQMHPHLQPKRPKYQASIAPHLNLMVVHPICWQAD